MNIPDLRAPLEDLPDVGQLLRGEVSVILTCWVEHGEPRVIMASGGVTREAHLVCMASALSFILDQVRTEEGPEEVEAVLRSAVGSHALDGPFTEGTRKALEGFGVTLPKLGLVRTFLDGLFG